MLLGPPINSFPKISTVVGSVTSITGPTFALHAVMFKTRYSGSCSHSMASQLYDDDMGNLGYGAAVVVAVAVNDVSTVSLVLLLLSFPSRTELSRVSTVAVISEASVTVLTSQSTALVAPLAV